MDSLMRRCSPGTRNGLFLLVLVLLTMPREGWGQLGGFDAEFAGAGARPLSMGGGFLALADDSTAAEFNPAGVRILRRPEFAWQVTRTWERRNEFLFASSFETLGSPAGEFRGLRGEDENSWTTPSFVSYVQPGEDFTWAISQLTNIDFVHDYDDAAGGRVFRSRTDVTNNAFGLTFAGDVQPRLHFGATLRMNRFDYQHQDSLIGPVEMTDWAPSLNLGILWRKSKDWSFGAVYKSSQKVEGLEGAVDTQLPETFGVGAAYHPGDRIRLVADIDYINWSEFDSIRGDQFRRNDVTRYHFGGEYLFRLEEEEAWFVRAGYMHEESNALFYDGPFDPLYTSGFPEEKDKDHLTFGVGLAREKYQIDLGVSHILEGGYTLILSMVHYF